MKQVKGTEAVSNAPGNFSSLPYASAVDNKASLLGVKLSPVVSSNFLSYQEGQQSSVC